MQDHASNSSARPISGVEACVSIVRDKLSLSLPDEADPEPERHLVTLDYLNEGGANVIYSIRPGDKAADDGSDRAPGGLPAAFQGKVLRIRKEQGLPHDDPTPYVTTVEVHRYFHTQIVPLVGAQHLLSHDLVSASPAVLRALNAVLEAADASGARPRGRRGSRLKEDEPYALVLADMRPESGLSFMLELKPKWLADSPTPPGVLLRKRRCRTCALRAMRAAKGKAQHAAGSAVAVCPLALGAGGERLRGVLSRVVDASAVTRDPLWPAYGESVMARLTQDFETGSASRIVERLKSQEEALDPHGVLSIRDVDPGSRTRDAERLGLAMTLRDCTMFIRMGWRTEGAMDVRLADLDQKDTETRIARWSETEEKLIAGGWYEGTDPGTTEGQDTEVCLLWHSL